MIGDLRAAQRELEDYYFADQDSVLKAVEKRTPADRRDYLKR